MAIDVMIVINISGWVNATIKRSDCCMSITIMRFVWQSDVLNREACVMMVKDDQTEENTFEILQHSDININNS